MALEFCKSANKMCDPTNCPQEFCAWRDTERAIKTVEMLTYQGSPDWMYKLASPKNEHPRKKDKNN